MKMQKMQKHALDVFTAIHLVKATANKSEHPTPQAEPEVKKPEEC